MDRDLGLLLRAQKRILQAHAFAFDAVHETASPNKFRREQSQPHENYGRARTWSEYHDRSQEQKCESDNNQEDAADLRDGAENHWPRKNFLAERVGFEPTVRFPARSLSRRVLSTTQSPLRSSGR